MAELVSKIFVPTFSNIQTTSGLPAGPAVVGGLFYRLPFGTFPLVAGFKAICRFCNLVVQVPAGNPIVGLFTGGNVALADANQTYIQVYPAFPVAPANFIQSNATNVLAFAFPVLPPPAWEWDDFATVGQQPTFMEAVAQINVTTGGVGANLQLGFNALVEVWKT